MNRGYCKDCKWWTPVRSIRNPDYYDTQAEYEEACRKSPPASRCICDLTHTIDWQQKYRHSKASPSGPGSGSSRLYTEPDFGCIQFEVKNTQAAN